MLISAYDIAHHDIGKSAEYPELLFVDSGGYEASDFRDLSDRTGEVYAKRNWTREEYKGVLSGWSSMASTVFVNYDHPDERCPTADQIELAKSDFDDCKVVGREILLKPETESSTYLKINNVINNILQLSNFDIVGFTEKELGNSIFKRMKNIALVRRELSRRSMNIPIHVFGSLDPITSVLYYISGADIFDGLTWLRYAYKDDEAIYYQNWGASNSSLNTPSDVIEGYMWQQNYMYLQELELRMKRFANDKDFKALSSKHGELFRSANLNLVE